MWLRLRAAGRGNQRQQRQPAQSAGEAARAGSGVGSPLLPKSVIKRPVKIRVHLYVFSEHGF